MLGLKFWQDRGLQKVRVPIPSLKNYDDHILVKVSYCGICGTDIDIVNGVVKWADNVILGHEISGTIFKLGSNVAKNYSDKYPIGANVTILPNYNCKKCYHCKKQLPNFCETEYGALEGTLGIGFDGGLAQYVRCHYNQCYLYNPNKLAPILSPLVEPLQCILNGFNKFIAVKKGKNNSLNDNILIFGFGIIGFLWSLTFYDYGFRNIYVCERRRNRANIAENCQHIKKVLYYDNNDKNKLILKDGLKGFDVAVDCAGETVEPLTIGYNLLNVGGTLISFGIISDSARLTINPSYFTRKEITIIGSILGLFTQEQAIEAMERFVEKGYINLNMVKRMNIVKLYDFNDYKNAIKNIEKGNICKAMIDVGNVSLNDSKL
eukprot:466800_1